MRILSYTAVKKTLKLVFLIRDYVFCYCTYGVSDLTSKNRLYWNSGSCCNIHIYIYIYICTYFMCEISMLHVHTKA